MSRKVGARFWPMVGLAVMLALCVGPSALASGPARVYDGSGPESGLRIGRDPQAVPQTPPVPSQTGTPSRLLEGSSPTTVSSLLSPTPPKPAAPVPPPAAPPVTVAPPPPAPQPEPAAGLPLPLAVAGAAMAMAGALALVAVRKAKDSGAQGTQPSSGNAAVAVPAAGPDSAAEVAAARGLALPSQHAAAPASPPGAPGYQPAAPAVIIAADQTPEPPPPVSLPGQGGTWQWTWVPTITDAGVQTVKKKQLQSVPVYETRTHEVREPQPPLVQTVPVYQSVHHHDPVYKEGTTKEPIYDWQDKQRRVVTEIKHHDPVYKTVYVLTTFTGRDGDTYVKSVPQRVLDGYNDWTEQKVSYEIYQEKVIVGYRDVPTKAIDHYNDWDQQVQVGTRQVTVPQPDKVRTVTEKVQVGTRTDWVETEVQAPAKQVTWSGAWQFVPGAPALGSIADAKRAWWQACANMDKPGMDAAEAAAKQLRDQGATIDPALAAQINAEGMALLNSTLKQAQRDYWNATFSHQQDLVDQAEAKAKWMRDYGASDDPVFLADLRNQALGQAINAWWRDAAAFDDAGMKADEAQAAWLRGQGAKTDEAPLIAAGKRLLTTEWQSLHEQWWQERLNNARATKQDGVTRKMQDLQAKLSRLAGWGADTTADDSRNEALLQDALKGPGAGIGDGGGTGGTGGGTGDPDTGGGTDTGDGGSGTGTGSGTGSGGGSGSGSGTSDAATKAADAEAKLWQDLDTGNLQGAIEQATYVAGLIQSDPKAADAVAKVDQGYGQSLLDRVNAGILDAKRQWWTGLVDESQNAMDQASKDAANWRALADARHLSGVIAKDAVTDVDRQGRQNMFDAARQAYAQFKSGAERGLEPGAVAKWLFYLDHKGQWLTGHEDEFTAPLSRELAALQTKWWTALTDGDPSLDRRKQTMDQAAADGKLIKDFVKDLLGTDLKGADEAALRNQAVQYANTLAQKLNQTVGGKVADSLQDELNLLAEYGIKPEGNGDGFIPTVPYNITNPKTPQEQWLASTIQSLNRNGVPVAAQNYVANAFQEKGLVLDVAEVTKALTWTQDKVNQTWQKALSMGVDPRIMLAIIIQEGTGSWDTNTDITTSLGDPGAQPDFQRDLTAAFNGHVIQKLRTFAHYSADFSQAVHDAGIPGDGNLFQYINYPTPMLDSSGHLRVVGGYATDVDWWQHGSDSGVMSFYRALTSDTGPQDLEAYLRVQTLGDPPEGWKSYTFRATTDGATGWRADLTPPHPWIVAYES